MFPWKVQILSSDKTEGVSPLPRLANPGANLGYLLFENMTSPIPVKGYTIKPICSAFMAIIVPHLL